MRIRVWIITLVAIALLAGIAACGKQQEEQPAVEALEYPNEPQFIFFPLPTFHQVFAKLENVETADYAKAVPQSFEKVEGSSFKQAYQLGALTADAIFSTQARDQQRLKDIAEGMMFYADMLGIEDQINPLTDKLTRLLENNEWDELEVVLEEERQNVVTELHRAGEYDIFMLLQVGGWTEALHNLTFLLLDGEFDPAVTSILFEIGTLNQLIVNYETISSERVKEKEFYAESLDNLNQILAILVSGEEQVLSRDSVQQIHNLCGKTRALFD
ncbi:MAG: hypothetical protein K8R90_03380 [Candidatus Cloacimonetes bacterium]|nr:hypothetical protein [Candidatus Cloacimonadota bacterium]